MSASVNCMYVGPSSGSVLANCSLTATQDSRSLYVWSSGLEFTYRPHWNTPSVQIWDGVQIPKYEAVANTFTPGTWRVDTVLIDCPYIFTWDPSTWRQLRNIHGTANFGSDTPTVTNPQRYKWSPGNHTCVFFDSANNEVSGEGFYPASPYPLSLPWVGTHVDRPFWFKYTALNDWTRHENDGGHIQEYSLEYTFGDGTKAKQTLQVYSHNEDAQLTKCLTDEHFDCQYEWGIMSGQDVHGEQDQNGSYIGWAEPICAGCSCTIGKVSPWRELNVSTVKVTLYLLDTIFIPSRVWQVLDALKLALSPSAGMDAIPVTFPSNDDFNTAIANGWAPGDNTPKSRCDWMLGRVRDVWGFYYWSLHYGSTGFIDQSKIVYDKVHPTYGEPIYRFRKCPTTIEDPI